MKVIFIKKKYIFITATIIFTTIALIYSITTDNLHVLNAYSPISDNTSVDINADGINDVIKVSNNTAIVTINKKQYNLSDYVKTTNNSSTTASWPLKMYLCNISRNLSPEIILQSNYDNKSTLAILSYCENSFNNIYQTTNNIFGIIHLDSNKTPICYSINSSEGISSLTSFMISNNNIIDVTKFNKTIPGIENILPFIDLIETQYELDSIPDIFSDNINSEELKILWNLDKDNNTYSFQDGFFIDKSSDIEGNINSISWRLTFEKFNKNNSNSKKELILNVITDIDNEGNHKISSIII
ncbi:hypothetical protein KQI77_04840 [Clostridium sp. MSJ-8]|uniref:hypothetical protein n=1 Tax=Clostridium sp. MSJ-8 TaxID=2841510 RepID=UPI001C0ECD20|nr:hypothetical protein [Clostridium sp. MSJ-8]MBU5487489.1 hypothetical protein [Clostridium sp. MSJ-8]